MKKYIRALLIAPLCGVFFCAPAYAQKTKAQLSTEITATFPDNTVGAITPAGVRTYESDVINSIMPTAPVVAGNLACFSGTTGLLQDCGTPPGIYALIASPTFTGTVTIPNGSILNTPASVTLTNAVGLPVSTGISGLGTGIATALGVNVGTAGSPVVNGGALGTPSSGVATNLTGTASGLTAGTVTTNANLTGPVTSVGNATTIGTNQVSRANEAQGVARSVIGVTGNATANVADIQGAAGQILAVNTAGTSLAFVGPGQTPGEPSTGSATAGNAGEYVVSDIAIGSAVGLTTGTNTNLTSISLTAGDWDVTFMAEFTGGATTTLTFTTASISTTTAAPDATLGRSNNQFYNGATVFNNVNPSQPIPTRRFSLASTTTIFAVVRANFSTSTCSAFGTLSARRVR